MLRYYIFCDVTLNLEKCKQDYLKLKKKVID